MKFIFFTIPAYGHLNPILGVAKGLIDRGHKVIIYNTEEFAEKIVGIGAEFRPPPIKIKEIDLRIMKNALKMAEISLYMSTLLVPDLVKIIEEEKPDCLLHDSVAPWGKVVGKLTRFPTISLVTSMGLNYKVLLACAKYMLADYMLLIKKPLKTLNIIKAHRELYRKNGISEVPPIYDLYGNREDLNIVFTSAYFQLYRESFGKDYKFIGPIIYDRHEAKLSDSFYQPGERDIYISLGTIYNDRLLFYKELVKIFSDMPYKVLISIGKYIKISDLGKVSDNILIKNYFPQLEVLKEATLFISHGGMNSINESLYFGVPMILMPQIQEQRVNSHRVEELGAGIYYKEKKIDGNKLLKTVNEVFNNASYKNNAEKIGATLKKAGGVEKAVEHILNFLS